MDNKHNSSDLAHRDDKHSSLANSIFQEMYTGTVIYLESESRSVVSDSL